MAKELTYEEGNVYFDNIDAAIRKAEGITDEQRTLAESANDALRDGKLAGLDGDELKEHAFKEISKKMTLDELGYEPPARPAEMTDAEYEAYCEQSEAAFLENDDASELYEKLYESAISDKKLNAEFDDAIKNMPDIETAPAKTNTVTAESTAVKTETSNRKSVIQRLQETAQSVKNYAEQQQAQNTTDMTQSI